MKTGLWAVYLWPDTKAVGGAFLDRMVSEGAEALRAGATLRPAIAVSLHSSASAADRAAARLAALPTMAGWWLAEGSAVSEQRQHAEEGGRWAVLIYRDGKVVCSVDYGPIAAGVLAASASHAYFRPFVVDSRHEFASDADRRAAQLAKSLGQEWLLHTTCVAKEAEEMEGEI